MGDRLKDKVAIVTGAGSVGPGWGNGKATAVLFAREGAKVFAVDINLAAAEETKEIIDQEEGDCTAHQTDVSKSEAVKAMVERCLETYGRVDILHNNVGILEVGGPVEASEASWDFVNNVNLKSIYFFDLQICPSPDGTAGGWCYREYFFHRWHPLVGGALHLLQHNQRGDQAVHPEHCHSVRKTEHPRKQYSARFHEHTDGR